jgi:hypothetical protein
MCFDCDWVCEDYPDTRKVRSEIYKHIRKTGHHVSVEKATVTKYLPESE